MQHSTTCTVGYARNSDKCHYRQTVVTSSQDDIHSHTLTAALIQLRFHIKLDTEAGTFRDAVPVQSLSIV